MFLPRFIDMFVDGNFHGYMAGMRVRYFNCSIYNVVHMKEKKLKPVMEGTFRIKSKGLEVYEKTRGSWRKSSRLFPEVMQVIELFVAHDNLEYLIDKKSPKFLKGQLSVDGKVQGARIDVLPDGRKLDKAYSLFAEHLTIHDETSNDHWDVLYRNPCGNYAYVYTIEKRNLSVEKKYKAVEEFGRHYLKLKRNVLSALGDKSDSLAVPMYTLLRTYMRVGNEIYYKAHAHKGLTTLKKGDISINGNYVTFDYLAKNGVPMKITEKFPDVYIGRLNDILAPIDKSSFVFVNRSTGHPISDVQFRDAFKRYCGEEFYPHIVRSYYATARAKSFLKGHSSVTKQEVRDFFLSIAEKLGHKRFVKKEHAWKESYTVTVHHYIQPELVVRIKSLVE